MANQNMEMVYTAFINAGLTPQQARAITAEVGRENDFNSKYVFGRHVDAANGRVNLGFLSWQGSRGKQLDQRMRAKGLITKGGNIARNQEALNEMARFAVEEIQTNPAYSRTKKLFLNNPNVDYDTAKEVLGNNFIRWDYAGNTLGKNVIKHHQKRDNYYEELGGVDVPESKEGTSRFDSLMVSVPNMPTVQVPQVQPMQTAASLVNNLFSPLEQGYSKPGEQTPVLSVDGQFAVPENENEFEMFKGISELGLPPEQESSKAKAAGLIAEAKRDTLDKPLIENNPLVPSLSELFKRL